MKKSTRRKFLFGTLTLAGAGAVAWFNKNSILRWLVLKNSNDGLKLNPAPLLGEDLCVLTSSQTEGPFFIASPFRKDIREDRKGKEMNLKMQILRMPDCNPIEGAVVEIWHCDAEGVYSGYPAEIAHDIWETLNLIGAKEGNVAPTNETRFLRGAQRTDANGVVEFLTIFPGWYDPRMPHIHFKVLIDEKELLTSQFYFEREFFDKLYVSVEPYSKFGKSPFHIQNDGVLGEGDTDELDGLVLNPIWNDDLPLEASAKIGLKQT
ncbi:MAG: hypothetical protein ACKVU0_04625 [Saprospiraceae bacterium]